MTIEMVTALIRHVLTFGGGWLVALGWFDDATMQTGVGALVTLIGVVWSVVAKYYSPSRPDAPVK